MGAAAQVQARKARRRLRQVRSEAVSAMNRRAFLQSGAAAAFSALTVPRRQRRPRILLRSSWQVVNIGDIAHTPGVLALLARYVPEADVRLWASADLSDEVAAMEHRRFPSLQIVKGTISADGKASNPDLADAIAWCDFLLHGSGASLVAARDVESFLKHTGKPFGVYGITHGSFLSGDDTALLSRASFVFFRDSVSLALARKQGDQLSGHGVRTGRRLRLRPARRRGGDVVPGRERPRGAAVRLRDSRDCATRRTGRFAVRPWQT